MRYRRYSHGVKLKFGRFTMLNGRTICLVVLCVLFISSTVFAQTDTIIEKIFESETRVREHVNQEVKGIETKVDNLSTKVDNLSTKVGTLSEDVRENKTNIGNMKEDIRELKGAVDRIWYGILGILGTLILSIVGFFLRSWWQNRGKAENVNVVDSLADQITNLTSAQAENSAQITRLISAQMEISATRNVPGHPQVLSLEELDELTGDIRSERYDEMERI